MEGNIIKNIDHQSEVRLIIDGTINKEYSDSYDLVFILDGELNLLCNNENHTIRTGDIILFGSDDTYQICKKSDKNFIFQFKMSISLLMKSIDIEDVEFHTGLIKTKDNKYKKLKESIHQIIKLTISQEKKANFMQLSYIFILLNEITSNFIIYNTKSKKKSRSKKIIHYINTHYNENLGLQEMADMFYMDSAYFSRFFKKTIGINFKEYLMNIRMNHALYDLQETDKTITTIAIDNGFANINSFNKTFKKNYHTTPSSYRNKYAIKKKKSEDNFEEIAKRYENYSLYNIHNQTQQQHQLAVTIGNGNKKIHSPWNVLINLGRAKTILSDGMKQHIKIVQDGLHYKFGRVWHVFSEDLYVDWELGTITNYYKLDEIFDFIIENHMSPWIELNKRALSTPRMQLIDMDCSKWETILTDFLIHISNRYGKKRVKNWRFEMTINDQYDSLEQKKYIRFYNITRNIIKKILPELQIGGACLKLESSILDEKNRLHSILGLAFDFYTFMAYPYYSDHIREKRNAHRSVEEEHLLQVVAPIRQLLEPYPKRQIYVSEWNNTVSNCNVMNDTLYKGAYIIKNILDIYDKVDGIGYWIISDVYHADPKNNEVLNGGSGLLNKQGMYKPAMMAMKFLNELKETMLICKDDNIIATRLEEDEITILCHNYEHPNSLYFYKNEDRIMPREVDSFFINEEKEFQIELHNIPKGIYELRTYACNTKNGSLFDKWREFDFIKELTLSDIAYLRKNNDVSLRIKQEIVKKNKLDLKFTLEAQEFLIVNIRRRTRINH